MKTKISVLNVRTTHVCDKCGDWLPQRDKRVCKRCEARMKIAQLIASENEKQNTII